MVWCKDNKHSQVVMLPWKFDPLVEMKVKKWAQNNASSYPKNPDMWIWTKVLKPQLATTLLYS